MLIFYTDREQGDWYECSNCFTEFGIEAEDWIECPECGESDYGGDEDNIIPGRAEV